MSRKALAWILAAVFVATTMHALDAPILAKPRPGQSSVKIDKLKLEWVPVTGAATYRVELSAKPNFATLIGLEKANAITKSATSADVSYTVALTPPNKLLPDTMYYWRVFAQCPPDAPACAESMSTSSFRTEISVKAATSRGFSLSLGREGDKAKKPASFKYAYTKEKGEVYTANYSLQWKRPGKPVGTRAFFGWGLFHDGSLSSDDAATDTAVRFGAQGVHDFSFGETESLTTRIALLHEANQRYDTGKNLGEVSFTPSWKRLAIGYAYPQMTELDADAMRRGVIPLEPRFQFFWEPTVTLTYGRTVKIGESAETRDTVQRYALRIATTTELNAVERLLNTRRVALLVTGTGWKLPNETIDEHDLLEATLQFDFTDNLSVGLDYKSGEQPPEFKGLKNYGLTIGVKF